MLPSCLSLNVTSLGLSGQPNGCPIHAVISLSIAFSSQHFSPLDIAVFVFMVWGFPGGSDGKETTCNVGDLCSIPGVGRSPGGGHGYPLQYSCLENPMNRGAWQATVHGVAESRT